MSIELIKYKKLKGKIKLISGLHIGGSKDSITIGETDKPVIKNPLDQYPYIPGSSLKGKVRTLLEWYLGKVDSNGDVHNCADTQCVICRLFGSINKGFKGGPGRVIFRDCFLDEKSRDELKKLKQTKGLAYIEEKTEIKMDRTTGSAFRGGLRQMERTPAGVSFDFELDYRVFSMKTNDGSIIDDENDFEHIKTGLALLQYDSLGGSGSRGYGKIKFTDLKDENDVVVDLDDVKNKKKDEKQGNNNKTPS